MSGKANSYSLMHPPPSILAILRGSRISQQVGHLLGRAKYKRTKTKFLPLEAPSQLPSNSLPPDNMDTTFFVTFTALLPQNFLSFAQ